VCAIRLSSTPRARPSPLFPYTPLFRSRASAIPGAIQDCKRVERRGTLVSSVEPVQTPNTVTHEAVCIAVVDDDPALLRSLSRLLRARGFDARTYQSASTLLADIATLCPSCVIADLLMPGIDGLELQRRLEDAELTVPLVFLTGAGDIPSSVLAMRHGAVDFLTKPYVAADLFDAVERALERDRAARVSGKQAAAFRQRAASLTRRERDVFVSLVEGLMNKQIAAKLGIAEKTVKIHRSR